MGAGAVLFGLVTLVVRIAAPDSKLLSKVEPLKERWGPRAGLALHVVAYTVVPLVVGSLLLMRAMLPT